MWVKLVLVHLPISPVTIYHYTQLMFSATIGEAPADNEFILGFSTLVGLLGSGFVLMILTHPKHNEL